MSKRKILKTWLAISVFLLVLGTPTIGVGGTIYVDADRPTGGNGTSWATAYKYLQDALAAAGSGSEIWVADGTYTPDTISVNPGGTGDRIATFRLVSGVTVYGGFAGDGETDPDARDIKLYVTTLSGDLNGDDVGFTNNEENSYHVVTGSYTDASTVLDGFTITAGNANVSPGAFGSGLINDAASLTVRNCTFSRNSGVYGAMNNWSGSPTITNCTFSNNSATGSGAAMGNNYCSSTITNCTFTGNSAAGWAAGAIYNNNGSDATITNCMFTGNSAGMGGAMVNSANSNPTVTNCTFTGNSANNGSAVGNGDSSPTLTNCIFWSNTPSWSLITGWGTSNPTVSYSDVQGGWTGLGGNNIDADPMFGDPANGDYHLKSRRGRWNPNANAGSGGWVMDRVHSPCIDTGNPDDPVGDEPAPNGNRVNMGAFGGTEFASKSWTTIGGDLVTMEMAVQETALAGRPVQVTWIVNNADPLNTIYAWFFDGVYLSTDEQWDIDDVLLTTVWRRDPLDPGQSYQADVDVIMPGVLPDNYYILVRTDLGNHVDEPGGEENNVTTSEPIFVDVEELTVDTAIESEFTDAERARYYRVAVVGEEDLETCLDDLDDAGSNELYISFQAVPARSQFDFCYPTNFVPDQTIRIPGTNAGIYYILAYAGSVPGTDPSAFSINAVYLPLKIASVTPDHCGNTEFSTLTVTIDGSGFEPNSIVVLRRGGQVDIVPTDTTFIDTGTMYARFNLHGAAAGLWNVAVTNPDSETVTFPFNVIEGGEPKLETRLILPSALGFHRRATLWIEYTNTGDASMPAPLLKLHGGQDALLTGDESLAGPGLGTANPPARLKDTVQVLAIGSGSAPGVLNPGDSGLIPVYYRGCKRPWDFSYPPIEFNLGVLRAGDTTPIDWAEVETQVRPYDIADDLWEAIWPRIKVRIGPTWGHYLRMLNSNAKYLAHKRKQIHWKHGYKKRAHIVRELFALEVAKAMGAFIPPQTLVSTVDTYYSAPGLPLVFGRVAIDTTTQRFALGPFGRGWSHNFKYSLELPDEFTAIVKGPNGTTRTFTRNQGYPWQAAEGDFGTLEDMPSGAHRLREKSGLVWFFGSNGALAYMQEPNGNRVTLSYTAGKLTAVNHSNGRSFTIVYNAGGFVKTITDPVGRQTRYTYDGSGEHLVSVTSPGNILTSYVYNPVVGEPNDHALTSITFPNASHMYFDYDIEGRLIGQWRDGQAEKVEFIYESFNTVIVRNASGAETTLHYSLPKQLLKVENPLDNVISFEYEDNFLNEITGPDRSDYRSVYDEQGNLIGTKDPLGNTISMGYTSGNYLAWLIDQKGNHTDFATDDRGNLTDINYPDSSAETFEYDDAGNVVSFTNRRGQTITYTYDSLDRLIRKEYPDSRSVTYAYDTVGRVTEVADASGTIALEYDDRGFLSRIEYPSGHRFTFAYNNAGQRTQRVGDDGYTLSYYYDVAGRLERLTDDNGIEIIYYEYDDTGRIIHGTKGNGTYTKYEYDAAGQMLSLVNYSPSGDIQSQFDYAYDENGNRTSMTTLDGTASYEYDALGQLVGVTYPDGQYVAYEYDPAGNRVAVTDNGIVTAYTTNNMNQYTQVDGTAYTYDADGNMKTKTEGGVTTTYTYDIENRLIGISTPTDTWIYTYDAFSNRIASMQNGVTTSYVVDPIGLGNVAAEYDDTGGLIARYHHGYGLVSRTNATDVPAYYTFDAIGSTSEITDPTGVVLNSYTYDPFGILLDKLETVANPFEYVGEYGVMNETNDLAFMRARFYDPLIGRFISEDPLGFLGDSNLYLYSGNSPQNAIDPLGLVNWYGVFKGTITATGGVLGMIAAAAAAPFTGGASVLPGIAAGYATGVGVGNIINSIYEVDPTLQGGFFGDIVQLSPDPAVQALGSLFDIAISAPSNKLSNLAATASFTGLKGTLQNWTQILGLGMTTIESIKKTLEGLGIKISEPDPPTPPDGGGSSGPTGSKDPNKKFGPKGFGSGGFIVSDQLMVYTIYFENDPNATAATLEVRLEDQLDEGLDWTTFELLEVGFGEHQITVPAGMSHYETSMDIDGWNWNPEQNWHTGEIPLMVDINADIDIITGLVTWNIKSYDPMTGWEPEDAYAGFLPPDDANDVTHRGEGYVSFMIQLRQDLPSGTQITNTGDIYFDYNPVIETNTVLNTIDDAAPDSYVLPLPATIEEDSFTVQWTGQGNGGSGIAQYDIYVSANEGPYTLWLSTLETSAVFYGQNRTTYAFYSVATDNVGNDEPAPDLPDAVIKILINDPPIANAGPDQTVECSCNTIQQTKVTLNGTGSSDPDGDPLTYTWTGPFDESPASGPTPTVTLSDGCPGEYIITLIVNDGTEDSGLDEVVITVADTTAPAISNLNANYLLAAVGQTVTFSAEVNDNCDDAVGTVWNFGDGTTSSSPSHAYEQPKIYTVTLTATDECGNETTDSIIIVVYDPTAGFTTGGGWFVPDSGSFIDGEGVTDTVSKANFGFIVKYKKGADNPDGNLEFQYKAGNIDLKSSDMEWLVVQSTTKVRFKGKATINSEGPYTFKVTAEDNGEPGTNDTFQIEIWLGVVIDTENGPPVPKHKAKGVLGGGNIQIHQK